MAADHFDPITNYSQTQRVVLLIDLNPLLHHQDPTPYVNSLRTSTKTLLSFPPLSSSLFSFKLFFSSLSPLLSASKLDPFVPNPSLLLSFNDPTSTLQSLSQTLTSLPDFHNASDPPPPRALHLAASMQQLVHDYVWDPVMCDPVPDTHLNCSVVRSNLVVLFSPICRSLKCLSEFFNVEIGNESLKNVVSFCEKFSGFFRSVRDAFECRDMHFSWIDARCESECCEDNIQVDELRQISSFFESGTKTLGWGFCSVNSVILGSALVPFGLIYPKIGISWSSLDINDYSRKLHVQLSLQILDVSRNPIEYNCCDLELINLRFLGKYDDDVRFNPEFMTSQTGVCERKEKFWKQFGHGITKFHIKIVQKCGAFVKLRDRISDSILVREVYGESKKKQKGNSNTFFADRVLEILAIEFGYMWQRKSVPIWQILLSFLYKEGCWALVSLSNGNGGSCMGILRPFTISSALLSLLYDPDMVHHFGGADIAQYFGTNSAEICKPDICFKKHKTLLASQAKSDTVIEGHQKKKMMDWNKLQSLTWSTFRDASYDHFDLDLHEVYYAMESNKSKKLKFLKCWMKQMKKPGCPDLNVSEKSKPNELIPEEINNRLTESLQDGGQPISCHDLTVSEKSKPNELIQEEIYNRLTESLQDGEHPISSSASAGENTMPESSGIQDDAVLDFRSETSEAFFSNLSNKIHQGIESEVVDLQALAERLVNSSIYCLSQKFDWETSDSQTPLKCHDAYGSMVAAEMIKVLLTDPKELAAKHKSRNPFSQASDPGPTSLTTEHIVREYELQILFRMEILQSDVGGGVEESSKQKFVKQICLLLENIQCHMEVGFFGDWNLDNYVAKIIKSRYSDTLGDVVHKIYNKMDLLLFAEEDKTPDHILNSEESNKSWKEMAFRDEMGENHESSGPVSAENEPIQLLTNDYGRLQTIKQEDHDRKVIEAKKRRERARRFSSFTSCIPDLQRLWAPKQKAMKPKSDPPRKLPTRKERPRASCDTVCETPMTGNKRSCPWIDNIDDDHDQADGNRTCGSVSRALFRDDH